MMRGVGREEGPWGREAEPEGLTVVARSALS